MCCQLTNNIAGKSIQSRVRDRAYQSWGQGSLGWGSQEKTVTFDKRHKRGQSELMGKHSRSKALQHKGLKATLCLGQKEEGILSPSEFAQLYPLLILKG